MLSFVFDGLGLSPKAKLFVSRKIRHLITKEGRSPQQAVAIALNMARAQGFKVPKAPR